MDNNYEVNKTIIRGKLVSIAKTYVLVAFDDNVGICHISNVSDYLVRDINSFFKLNQEYNFMIIGKRENNQFNLSFKAIHPKFLKSHKDVIATPNGFDNIKKDLDRRLEKL